MAPQALPIDPTNSQSTLWLIDDDPALRLILADTFSDAQLNVVSFTQAKAAWTRLNDMLQSGDFSAQPDVILTDIRMPLMDGLSFSDWVHEHFPELPIVIMTAHSDLQSAVESYQTGAFEYLPKPFDLDEAVSVIKKAIQPRLHSLRAKQTSRQTDAQTLPTPADNDAIDITSRTKAVTSTTNEKSASQNNAKVKRKNTTSVHRSSTIVANKTTKAAKKADTTGSNSANAATAQQVPQQDNSANRRQPQSDNPNGIIGQSAAMQTVFRAIGRLSHSPITVLITGESGTGKELVANALHQHSPRRHKPFIALNMAAIPHDLIESELFGHEKGAFTGASTQRQGRFEQANGGTLFLDEIGDMPFSTQTRLLRVLANGEFYRVGGQKPIKVDVRIIAATHQNLEHLVKLGKFREDLFYRLNVIRLPLPPLRERREDIPDLVSHFMQQAATEMDTEQKYIDPQALAIMQAFDWSGNVRQIENVCRWLTVMATGEVVFADDLPPELLAFVQQQAGENLQDSSHFANHNHRQSNASTQTQHHDPRLLSQYSPASTPTAHSSRDAIAITDQGYASTESLSPTQPTAGPRESTEHVSQQFDINQQNSQHSNWQQALAHWANQALARGESEILQLATPEFERVLLQVALNHSKGRKGEAALLLGWGRNTLTRKLKQLDNNDDS